MIRLFSVATCILFIATSLLPGVQAQISEPNLTARRTPASITMFGQYQRYQFNETYITETSAPLKILVPFGRFSLGVQTSLASTNSERLQNVQGRSDVFTSLGYVAEIGNSSLVISISGAIPTGTEKLTREEFNTTILLSQVFYRFRVPAFGQGYSLIPNATWAIPVGRNVALGIGLTYQTNGAYTPVVNMIDKYKPGSHYTVAAGLDVRLSLVSSISGDVKYARYQADKLGEVSWFTAGDRFTVTLQYKMYLGHDEMRFTGRYQTHADGNNQASAVFAEQNVRALPNHTGIAFYYRKRLPGNAFIGTTGSFRYYGATDAGIGLAGRRVGFEEQRLVDLGVFSEIPLAEPVTLLLNFSGTAGSFSGVSGGIGLRAEI